jgi:glucose/mannose transport system permease protein
MAAATMMLLPVLVVLAFGGLVLWRRNRQREAAV